jgi:hypothetical protein
MDAAWAARSSGANLMSIEEELMRSTTSVEVARTPEDVTASWLSRVLGAPVEEVTIAAVGTGQMGSLVRATITPADAIASDLPASVIVKQAARLDDVRQLCGKVGRAVVTAIRTNAPEIIVNPTPL